MSVRVAVGVAVTAAVLTGTASAQAVSTEVSAPKPTSTIGVGSNPIAVVVSEKNGEAYVANDGSISVIDVATNKQVDEVGTGETTNQADLALGRGDSRAYVVNPQLKTVLVWKTATRSDVGTVRIGAGGTSVVVGGKGKKQRAYVARLQVRKVATFHTRGKARVQQVKVPGNPAALAVAPDGRLWVASANDSIFWVIGRNGGKIQETIRFSENTGSALAMAFSPDGDALWVVGMGGLRALDVATHRSLGFVKTPKLFGRNSAANPSAIAFSPSGRSVLVVNGTFPDAVPPQIATVTAVDTRSFVVGTRWHLGHQSYSLAVDSSTRTAYAPNYADDTLSYFRTPR